jgi:2-(1,2-epoxy-1,2-dihydrophenyl)acetyl-CoA isomerase
MEFETIQYEKSESIATITLYRPDNMNTFNILMFNELASILETVAMNVEIRVVILTGEGRAFSAGADVNGVDELVGIQKERPENQDVMKLISRIVLNIRQAPKPVVAALNGVAAGVGANIAMACDIIIASETARLAEVFINIGLVPDGGGTYFIPETIGYHMAAELFFRGKVLSAQEAHTLGLYNRIVPEGEALNAARELANELTQKPPLALAAGKSLLNREAIATLRGYLDDETCKQRQMVATHDVIEGITAFIEKRQPKFIGN